MAELFANIGDPDQAPHFAASDLGLNCLPITLIGAPEYNGLTQASHKRDIGKQCNPKSDSQNAVLIRVYTVCNKYRNFYDKQSS